MNHCPECQKPLKNPNQCRCGWSVEVAPTPTSKSLWPTGPMTTHQCTYTTGEWRCRWGKAAAQRDVVKYCDFHALVLQKDLVKTHDQYLCFLEEREYMQKMYPEYSFYGKEALKIFSRARVPSKPDGSPLGYVDDEAGYKAVPDHLRPFWYLPEDRQWKALTGLPLPSKHEMVALTEAMSQ